MCYRTLAHVASIDVLVNLLARPVEPPRREGPLNAGARRWRFAGAEPGAPPVHLSAIVQVLLGKPRIGVRGAEDTSHVLDHVFVHPKRLAGFLGRRGIRLQYSSRDVLADANPDGASVLDTDLLTRWRIESNVSTPSVPSDDDAATVEAASAETAPGDAHSWCVIS